MSTQDKNQVDDEILITDLAPRNDVKGGAGSVSGKLRFGETPLKDLAPASPTPDEQERIKGGKPSIGDIPVTKPIDVSSP